MFKRFYRWVKRKITRPKPTVYRPSSSGSSGSKKGVDVMHPLAIFKEDLDKFYSPYKFKFDSTCFFILHFTSGRLERRPRDFIKRFLEMNLNTYFIDGKAVLWQQHDGDRCGHHTGDARIKGKQIKRKSTGVEVACSGKVDKISDDVYESWFGQRYSKSEVREITKEQVRSGDYDEAGFFIPFTDDQETMIAELMAWHVAKGLPKENILGHDNVAYKKGRKADPSGCLSMPLKVFIEKRVIPLVSKY